MLLLGGVACGPPTPPPTGAATVDHSPPVASAPPPARAREPEPCAAPAPPPPPPSPTAPASAPLVAPPAPAAPEVVIGPAKGGPRGTRKCEFRESVDTYARTCTVTQDPDGALTVTAQGTKLNPDNGFTFRMGGGPNAFDVTGKLDAFGICKGRFSGRMQLVQDGGAQTYEARFRDHCMIVVR